MTEKKPKDKVDYSKGMPKSHCGICKYYHDHKCDLVAGRIEPHMWCKLFAKVKP